MRDKIITMENLKKRGFALTERCPLCGCDNENAQHIFVQCGYMLCFHLRKKFLSNSLLANLVLDWKVKSGMSSREHALMEWVKLETYVLLQNIKNLVWGWLYDDPVLGNTFLVDIIHNWEKVLWQVK